MYSRIVFALCTIAIFLFMISSSVIVAEERHHARTKLANAPWLSAPHFQMIAKRGRFVFRDAPNDHDHFHDLNDMEDGLHPDKRNWRL